MFVQARNNHQRPLTAYLSLLDTEKYPTITVPQQHLVTQLSRALLVKEAKYNDEKAVKQLQLKKKINEELKITNNPVSQARMNDGIDKLISLVCTEWRSKTLRACENQTKGKDGLLLVTVVPFH